MPYATIMLRHDYYYAMMPYAYLRHAAYVSSRWLSLE